VGCFCFFVFQAWILDHLRFVSLGCWNAVFKVILSCSLAASIIWLLLCNTIRQPNNITNCISFSRCKYTFHAKLFVFCLLLIKKNMYVLLLINLIANLIKYVYKLLIWLHIYKYAAFRIVDNRHVKHILPYWQNSKHNLYVIMYCKMYHRLFSCFCINWQNSRQGINQDIWIANCHLFINKLLNIYIAENNCLIDVVFLSSDG